MWVSAAALSRVLPPAPELPSAAPGGSPAATACHQLGPASQLRPQSQGRQVLNRIWGAHARYTSRRRRLREGRRSSRTQPPAPPLGLGGQASFPALRPDGGQDFARPPHRAWNVGRPHGPGLAMVSGPRGLAVLCSLLCLQASLAAGMSGWRVPGTAGGGAPGNGSGGKSGPGPEATGSPAPARGDWLPGPFLLHICCPLRVDAARVGRPGRSPPSALLTHPSICGSLNLFLQTGRPRRNPDVRCCLCKEDMGPPSLVAWELPLPFLPSPPPLPLTPLSESHPPPPP